MTIKDRTLKDIIDKEFKSYAMYTLQQRAIPSAIDGLKIVHRKILYGMNQDHKTGRVKVAEISGKMSSYEYAHGEVSAADAAIKLAAKYRNNVNILEPHGIFGTRLVQEAAEARYIYVSLSDKFKKYFSDFEVLPKNIYDDQPEPTHYLPIVPWLLLNGAEGIAVGFKCNVLPRSEKTVVDAIQAYLKAPDKFVLDESPLMPSFPDFRGEVIHIEGNKFATRGVVNYIGKFTFEISELPVGYDREKYIEVLEGLEEKELIKGYSDECSKTGFKFHVKVSATSKNEIEKDPIKFFKLEKYETEIWNLIDKKGKLLQLSGARELIKYFMEYRLEKVAEKQQYDLNEFERRIFEHEMKRKFIELVVNQEFKLDNMKKADLLEYIERNVTATEYAKKLLHIPLYECTVDAIHDLDEKIQSLKDEKKTLNVMTAQEIYKHQLKSVIESSNQSLRKQSQKESA